MIKRLYSFLILVAILTVIIVPSISQAALVKCGNNTSFIPQEENWQENYSRARTVGECDFTDFIRLLNDLINWFITGVGLLFTGLLVWGGFQYMTSNGNAATKQKAIDQLWGTLKGFIIILCAWLIVYTIVNLLAAPDQKNSILKFLVK